MQTLLQRLSRLTSADWFRSVGTLVGGTAVAQVLALALLPVLTRMYSPQDFSLLAVLMSTLTIGAVITTMRLELAIPLPEADEDAMALVGLVLVSTTVVSLLTFGVVLQYPVGVATAMGQQPGPWLLCVPMGLFLVGAFSAFQFWATRRRMFGDIARTRIAQSLGGVASQGALGWTGFTALGLVAGHTIGLAAGVAELGLRTMRAWQPMRDRVGLGSMRRMLRVHWKFPMFSTLEALANVAGSQVPMIVIAAAALGGEAGYLALATRVMAAPFSLLGGSVGQVYLSKAPSELRQGRLDALTLGVVEGLARMGVGPIVCAGIVAPAIFGEVFGGDWHRAGDVVLLMVPMIAFQLVASPISMVMHISGRQRQFLLLTVLGGCGRLGSVLLAGALDPAWMIEAFAVSGAVFYAASLLVFTRTASLRWVDLGAVLRRSWLIIGMWMAVGFAGRALAVWWLA